ncbi:MAG: toll/interleukin-1 receptor domain-containing protein [Alphaproteobacteria bacterium]|nr:MAG: toll/interleukin-1 receptor domain-containing protein [Alphaproteobacteria bacterium]
MADVFISYRRSDRSIAETLYKALKQENLDVWWDAGLQAGDTFDEKIQQALQSAKAVIVLWSPDAVESEWVRGEGTIGRERGVLVPVMVKPVNIPVPFNLIHTADLCDWRGDRSDPIYRDVVARIKKLASKQNVKPLKPPPNRALRRLWQTVAAVAVIAVAGASLWVFRPWEALKPVDRVAEAEAAATAAHTASRAKLAAFGVGANDFETFSGRHIARQTFDKTKRDQLSAEALNGDPAVLALRCAVDLWATEDALPDWEGAREVCAGAAEAGEPAAHVYYGQLLDEAVAYTGSDEERAGVEASAASEFRKAAEKGFGWGEVEYGWRLREGRGVPADKGAAEAMFKSAQAKGLPAGSTGLGRLYLSGEVASPIDANAAFAMVRRAADQGDAGAQYFMAEKLVEGWDMDTDYPAALDYYIKAAAADEGDVSWRAERMIEDTRRRVQEAANAPPKEEAPPN